MKQNDEILFNKFFGLKDIDKDNTTTRIAVRGIIFKDNKLLLNKTINPDYKLPGGGINSGESMEQALIREIEEETGHVCIKISKVIGKATERRINYIDQSKYFEMVSFYFVAKVAEWQTEQKLDDYENTMNFMPEWTDIDTAISLTAKYIEGCEEKDHNKVQWAQRELAVFKTIKEIGTDIFLDLELKNAE